MFGHCLSRLPLNYGRGNERLWSRSETDLSVTSLGLASFVRQVESYSTCHKLIPRQRGRVGTVVGIQDAGREATEFNELSVGV